jgi:hypothetical protein
MGKPITQIPHLAITYASVRHPKVAGSRCSFKGPSFEPGGRNRKDQPALNSATAVYAQNYIKRVQSLRSTTGMRRTGTDRLRKWRTLVSAGDEIWDVTPPN